MSGHSKWNNIKRKKEKTDAQKAKIFTKVGREIAVAVKSGGAGPAVNGKLRDLVAHILGIFLHVTALILFKSIRIIPAGMVEVNGKIGMVPVDQRVIETDVQPLCAESVHIFAYQIPAAGCIGGFIIRIFAVEQTEALMMLGGQNRIFHSGGFCLSRPVPGIAEIRTKKFKIDVILFFRDFFAGLDPFMARRQRVKTEVDEHAETVMGKPCGIARRFTGNVTGHSFYLSFCLPA